jgi:hypothetical protein
VERANSPVTASKISFVAAWAAIGASVAAFALLVSLHVLSPEFSPAWRMISEYANGRYAWVLSLMFIAYGASALMLAVAIGSQLTPRTRKFHAGVVLLVLSGIAAASAARFDVNQAELHDLAGAVGILCLPLAAMLISPDLAATAGSNGARKLILVVANLTWVSVVLWVASFVVMIATFVHVLGGLPSTPPEELPAGVFAVVGWTNRLMVLSAWGWVVIVAWHVIRLRSYPRRASQNACVGRVTRKEIVGA